MHRNPTAGPAESDWLFGHVWVCVALLIPHGMWGTIALPILSELYVRRKNVAALQALSRSEFRTKLELAADLMEWIVGTLRGLGSRAQIIAVFDGAYAAAPLLKPLAELRVTVVSRLRRDASLFDLPDPPVAGRRGRPRIYGEHKLSLAKRAGQLVEHRLLASESVVEYDGGNDLLGRPLRGTRRPQRPRTGASLRQS